MQLPSRLSLLELLQVIIADMLFQTQLSSTAQADHGLTNTAQSLVGTKFQELSTPCVLKVCLALTTGLITAIQFSVSSLTLTEQLLSLHSTILLVPTPFLLTELKIHGNGPLSYTPTIRLVSTP